MKRNVRQIALVLAVIALTAGVSYLIRARLLKNLDQVEGAWAELTSMMPERYRLTRELGLALDAGVPPGDNVWGGSLSTVHRIDSVWNAFETASTTDEQADAMSELDGLLLGMLATIRDDPSLRRDGTISGLATRVITLEDQVAVRKMRLDLEVDRYNRELDSFPGALFARAMGFAPLTCFGDAGKAGQGGRGPETDTGP